MMCILIVIVLRQKCPLYFVSRARDEKSGIMKMNRRGSIISAAPYFLYRFVKQRSPHKIAALY